MLEKTLLPIYLGLVLIDLYALNHQMFLHDVEKPNGENFVHLKLFHNFFLTNWNFSLLGWKALFFTPVGNITFALVMYTVFPTKVMANLLPLLMYVPVLSLNLYSLIFFIELGETMKKSGREKEFGEDIANFAGFEFCYFTLWNFIFQILFTVVAIADEVSKLMKCSLVIQKRLSKTRAVMYNTILFPSTLLVMSMFWTLWFKDRELVFPKVLDVFFPSWLNHMLHTFIIMPVIIELLIPKKYNFVKFEKSAIVLSVLFILYQILYFSIYFRHGVWLYAVYKTLTWPQRLLFTVCQFLTVLGYQKLGIALQNSKKHQPRHKVK